MKMKNLGKITGIIIVILIVGVILWVKFFPAGKIKILQDNNNPISKLICVYPVKVVGDSMKPFLQPDTKITFDKCFKEADLKSGIVIVYKAGAVQRIGIIRSIQNLGRTIYKASNELRSQELVDVQYSDIVGIYDIDTSSSSYISDPKNIPSSQLSDYMSEAYLGTIPRGNGLETSEIVKTSNFNLKVDNFCFVLNPVKELFDVDIEIWEESSNSIIQSIMDIIYNPGENKNCINTYENPLELSTGQYMFKIYVDNVLIKSIDFTVE